MILTAVLPSICYGKVYDTDILVLGAGMAGAGIVETLAKNNIPNYLVLEAQHVIGGRLKGARFGGINIELGANWIEGINGPQENPLLKIQKKLNLRCPIDQGEGTYIETNGRIAVSTRQDEFDKAIETAQELVANRSVKGLEEISVRTALDLVGWKPQSAMDDAIEFYTIENEFADNIDIMNSNYTLNYGTERNFGPDLCFFSDQRGMKILAESIFNNANARSKVMFGQIVKKVSYNANGVIVYTKCGDVFRAKYAISTFSLGVLQSHAIEFEPKFPDWKVEALGKFRMQTFTKIFLNFPYKFWNDTNYLVFASEGKGEYSMWVNLEAMGVPQPKGSNILVGIATGEEAKRIDRLSNSKIMAEALVALRRMYPGAIIPNPTQIIVPKWYSDPLFKGSYTNWPIGMSNESWENLVAPLANRLFFSGEMASFEYFGYIHGAYLAGIDTAESVTKCLKGKCPSFPYYPFGLLAATQSPSFT